VVAFDLIRSKNWKWRAPAWVWPIGIGAAIALFGVHDNVPIGMKIQRAWFISLMIGLIYANVKEAAQGWVQSVMHWIAEHSYGIYLSHMVVMWFAIYVMASAPLWARIIVLIAGSIGVPALLYSTIEKPFILVGSHIAKRLMARPQEEREHTLA
jgi:peptidoglycan/LPS O-acetylase OafA/YrhL